MPGTALVIGVRLAALGEMTPRSVTGVKAAAGTPGRELLAGVVFGLLVVRSGLGKQVASARRPSKALRSALQGSAKAGEDARIAMASTRRVMNLPLQEVASGGHIGAFGRICTVRR